MNEDAEESWAEDGALRGCAQSSPEQPQSLGASYSHSQSLNTAQVCCSCAATNQDSGLVLTACNFSFSSLATNPVCPQGGCLGLVHSRGNTEVLEGGRDCAGTLCCSSCVGQSQRGVSPWAWGQTGNPSPATGKEKCESRKEQMQDVWKRFPGHSGQNPLFNFPLHPASFVSHCAAPGEGTARPVPASWSPPARQQLTALSDT